MIATYSAPSVLGHLSMGDMQPYMRMMKKKPPRLTALPGTRVERLRVAVTAPDGRQTWECEAKPPPALEASVEPCVAPETWYAGPGHYVATVDFTSPGHVVHSTDSPNRIESVEFDADDSVFRVDIRVPFGLHAEIRHVPETDVRLRLAAENPLEAILQNEGASPIYTLHASRLERQVGSGWMPVEPDNTTLTHNAEERDAIAPHGSLPFGFFIGRNPEPGFYRLVALYQLRARPTGRKADSRPEEHFPVYEAVSDPFSLPDFHQPVACGPTSAELEAKPNAHPLRFASILRTSAGLLVAESSGNLRDLGSPGHLVIGTVPPGSALATDVTGDRVVASGAQRLLSKDGGRTFAPVGTDVPQPGTHYVFAGSRLLELHRDGTIGWREESGVLTPIATPVHAAWRGGAFRDDQHGVIFGSCSVLLETSDGGASWTLSATPERWVRWARWRGSTLWLTGGEAVWQRSAKGTFEAKAKAQERYSQLPFWTVMEGITTFDINVDGSFTVHLPGRPPVTARLPDDFCTWTGVFCQLASADTDGSLYFFDHESVRRLSGKTAETIIERDPDPVRPTRTVGSPAAPP